jgi:hypothetical protein
VHARLWTLTCIAELSQDRAAQLKEAHEKNKALTEALNENLQEKVTLAYNPIVPST